jgi:hypothetical protein
MPNPTGGRFQAPRPCQLAQLTGTAMVKDRLTCQRTVRSLSNPQGLCQSDPFQGSHHAAQVPTEALRPSFVFSSFSVLALYFPYPQALPSLFKQARLEAAKLLEPKVVQVSLPHRTIRTVDEAREWLNEVETLLGEKLKDGPVML